MDNDDPLTVETRYRCFSMEHTAATKTKSAEGFIDGDLVEHFLDLPQEKMEQICKGIKVNEKRKLSVHSYHALLQ